MTKAREDVDGVAENVPLRHLPGRSSTDSTHSSDLGHLISDDLSDVSSVDHLPPTDGGRQAWTVLLGCWLVEAMMWGFPLAFGVFQRYYTTNDLFKDSSSIPTIGALATGVSFLGMPFTNPIVLKWPQHRRKMCVAGWLMCLIGLLGASFATQTWHLLLFQGLLYGLGWVVCYTPFLFMLNEWFVAKRGLVYGILFGASGVTGMLIPVVEGWLLDHYGFRTALRAYAVAAVVVSGPALFLIKPRTTHPHQANGSREKDGRTALQTLRPFAFDAHFLIFATAVFVQGLGYFLPNTFIPSFAEDLGLSTSASSGLLALISLSQIIGQFWQGWISDRVNVYIPLSSSALISGLAALLLWGPGKGVMSLAPFAFTWGLFSASYSVLYIRICNFLMQKNSAVPADEDVAMLLFGFFSFERGISSVLEGPISSWLLGGEDEVVDVTKYALGRYASIVWFTVFCMLASSLAGVGWVWARRKDRKSTFSSSS